MRERQAYRRLPPVLPQQREVALAPLLLDGLRRLPLHGVIERGVVAANPAKPALHGVNAGVAVARAAGLDESAAAHHGIVGTLQGVDPEAELDRKLDGAAPGGARSARGWLACSRAEPMPA